MRSVLRSPAVIDAWFDTLEPAPRELARAVCDAVLHAEPSLEMAITWGNLVFSLRRTHALAIAVHREHVDLQVFNGVALLPRHPQLAGTGRALRHLRLAWAVPLDVEQVRAIARDCVAAMRLSAPG
jgi:hypothetical protein